MAWSGVHALRRSTRFTMSEQVSSSGGTYIVICPFVAGSAIFLIF